MSVQQTMIKNPRGNPICKRTYFQMAGNLRSPLLIGSGEDDKTDADVLLDAYGKPFLPGTALAGALKHAAKTLFGVEAAEDLFGKSQAGTEKGRLSKVFVYDVDLNGAHVSARDGVRLDEYKTAADMAKYEVQMLEAGASFVLYLELVEREDDVKSFDRVAALQKLLAHLANGEIALGAKGNRGFGQLSAGELWCKTFSMKEATDREAWLTWNWREKGAFAGGKKISSQLPEEEKLMHCLSVPLKVKGTLLIRTHPKRLSDSLDYMQQRAGEKAVIPGSSWMGAIRARLVEIMRQLNPALDFVGCQRKLECFFGTWAQEKNKEWNASLVKAEEAVLSDSHFLLLTRNAIDRFTGGTVTGALYTAEVAVQGQTTLRLCWPRRMSEVDSNVIGGLLLWAVKDLQAGLLAVGGETAVGRGIFEGCSADMCLDSQPISAKQECMFLQAAVDWCRDVKRSMHDER